MCPSPRGDTATFHYVENAATTNEISVVNIIHLDSSLLPRTIRGAKDRHGLSFRSVEKKP